MNVLNRGRCSRCIASEMKPVVKDDKIKKYRFCKIFQKYCRRCSFRCKAPPMGVKSIEISNK